MTPPGTKTAGRATSLSPLDPDELRELGRAVWDRVTASRDGDALWEALALEACRMVDRLDQLNDIIAGKGVLQLMHLRRMDQGYGDIATVQMTVDDVLKEAREQAGQLRQVAAQLKLADSRARTAKGGDALDQLAARRTERLASGGGSATAN